MSWSFVARCRVPESLDSVTSKGLEVDSRDVGAAPGEVERIWSYVEDLYGSGIHPAIQLCVRCQGEVVLDRAIGHAAGNGPEDPAEAPKTPCTPATPFNLFSASKAVTAMLVHLLDQRNMIRLDDPVCEYIPEFGVRSKRFVTIRHILSHRAGMPSLPPDVMQLDRLGDPDGIVKLLCEAEPTSRPGRVLAYHAITGGFILAELIRRVTGKPITAFLDEAIRRPLGFRWLRYGVPARDVGKVALSYFTGPPGIPPLSILLRRAIGVDFRDAPELANDRRFLTAVVPSGNLIATANEASRFYQLLLNGGELDGVRVFDPRTIRRAIGEQSYFEIDFSIGLPLRYGLGFMLGGEWFSLFGPDTQRAYGHVGFTNVVTWADPDRRVAAALLTSGKPLVYPGLRHAYQVLWQIGTAFPKLPDTDL